MSPAAADQPVVLVERRESVAIVTLNRPTALNAVNAELADALGTALEQLDADPSCAVIVLTGAGRAFSAGADLKAIGSGESVYPTQRMDWGFGGIAQHDVRKPIVAAVNGFALGGGLEMILACDLVVMADSASLGLPEVTRGLIAAAGGALRLTQHLPQKIATEALLVGTRIDAPTALRWGLVNRVVPAEDVLTEALGLAGAVAANAPLAVQATKELSRALLGAGTDWEQSAWRRNDELRDAVQASDDAREGPRAFAEKRVPIWSGR